MAGEHPSFSLAATCSHRSTLCVSQSLADRCAQKQGAFAARIREYDYREVVAANAEGERLIIIDGMVLDVKRWLPEHPGGSKVRTSPSLLRKSTRCPGLPFLLAAKTIGLPTSQVKLER